MDIGLISIIESVRKFCIPFLVGDNLTLLALEPVVFCNEPSVKNFIRGPLARVIAVLIGSITSSACFIVGAVVICLVVLVSTFCIYDCTHDANNDLAAPLPTIKYNLLIKRIFIRLFT